MIADQLRRIAARRRQMAEAALAIARPEAAATIAQAVVALADAADR